MSLLKYFTKTSSSAAVSEGTGSVSLAQTNEGSRRPDDGDSCASEVETSATPIVSERGRNLKRKTVSAPKRRRWSDDYVTYCMVSIVQGKKNTVSIHPLIICFV